jgi:hypothetical protein
MNTLQGVVCGAVVLGSFVALWFGYRGATRKRRLRFQDRPDMSKEEFFSTYYADSGIAKETVFEVLTEIANAIEIPATKIRPADRFDAELAPVKGWEYDDGLADVYWFVESKTKKAGLSGPTQLHTVDDLIRYIARLETQNGHD